MSRVNANGLNAGKITKRRVALYAIVGGALGLLAVIGLGLPVLIERGLWGTGPLRDCPDCPRMATIPTGHFSMGALDGLGDQVPVHRVNVSQPFAASLTEITVGQFRAFVEATGYAVAPGCYTLGDQNRIKYSAQASWQQPGYEQSDQHPVTCLMYQDMMAYIGWLNSRTGGENAHGRLGPYRLPSEAEWEYLARGGAQSAYSWGDQSPTCNHKDPQGARHRACGEQGEGPQPVAQFKPNGFGLYDVHGSLWELTDECWQPRYPQGPTDQSSRLAPPDCPGGQVMRGGNWFERARAMRVTNRGKLKQSVALTGVGFRVVKDLSGVDE